MPRREIPAGVEVRSANAEEMEDFRFIANLALQEHGNPMRDPVTFLQPEWSTCVFEHGELSTTFGAWPFSMRFNGERAHVAGVTAVGTNPTKRRRGYLRFAMEHSLDEQYERGQSLAALYASQAGIYQRFGYAICSRRNKYELDPADLSFVHAPTPTGTLSISNAKDLPDDAVVIRDLYRKYMQPRNGLLHRGINLWSAEVLDEPGDIAEGPVRVLLYEEDGEALGYMVFTSREDQSLNAYSAGQRDHRMTIREYGWLTPAAYVALWQYAASQDLTWRIHRQRCPDRRPDRPPRPRPAHSPRPIDGRHSGPHRRPAARTHDPQVPGRVGDHLPGARRPLRLESGHLEALGRTRRRRHPSGRRITGTDNGRVHDGAPGDRRTVGDLQSSPRPDRSHGLGRRLIRADHLFATEYDHALHEPLLGFGSDRLAEQVAPDRLLQRSDLPRIEVAVGRPRVRQRQTAGDLDQFLQRADHSREQVENRRAVR